ncbi:MAG: hypothetical protein BroJett040_00460 [Oligoflexia bacterium]|nr:MAG: hypothetical protein BroJett040_00460 [Oligoflexia bacterium]
MIRSIILGLILSEIVLGAPKAQPSSLILMKRAELGRQWGECAKLGKRNFDSHHTLRPWVLNSWMKCARKFSEASESKDAQTESLLQSLLALKKNEAYLAVGPWRQNLWNEMVRGYFEYLDKKVKFNPRQSLEMINNLMPFLDRLEKDQKSKLYGLTGDVYLGLHQPVKAKHFYQLSLGEKDSKSVRDKLNSVYTSLNEAPVRLELPSPIENLSDDERKFDERLQAALKQSDWVTYVEDGVLYLNQFPNGVRAKAVQEKIFEIYQDLTDKLNNSENPPKQISVVHSHVLSGMDRVHSARAFEWALRAHKKADYRFSLRMGEVAHKDFYKTPQGSVLLYVLGRSAQLTGQYQKAQTYFRQYIQYHPGADDMNEVLFRLALVQIRKKEYASAISTLERLLVSKGADRYELSSRYWIVRCLQAEKNMRALEEAALIIDKYPLSYYGIRLSAERKSNYFEWPADQIRATDVKQEIPFVGHHNQVLSRAQLLAQNEWYLEAQSEVVDLPQPKEANLKANQARQWVTYHAFPSVIKLINEAIDLNPQLRSLDLISIGFPKVYLEKIQKESSAKGLSPYLVRSLIRQESAFGLKATSTSNALGLMQLIPPTAQEVAQELNIGSIQIPDDLYESELNITMGTHYISKMIDQFGGNVPLGLAAYNAGPHRIRLFLRSRPELQNLVKNFSSDPFEEVWFDEIPWYETSFYVKAILRNMIIYRSLDQGRVSLDGLIWENKKSVSL